MATRKKSTSNESRTDFSGVAKVIEKVPVHQFLEKSFLSYAYMVILSRAIPDARDGLKPVYRRVLYTMLRNGYTPEKNHVKSAKIVGDTMGTFHPHGSAYGTLVRMAQDHSMMVTLVDGHGNFGSPGDGPASDRYTESRLNAAAMMMLQEVKENAVPMIPNYDGSTEEPAILPAEFPNLLVNGSTGIAVGMGCNLPTHNPDEIIAATRWLLAHPDATLEKLMEFVPGPDFPTRGLIIGTDAIKQAYETGRGIIKIRARHTIESLGRGKSRIIVTEMPYETSIEKVIKEIKEKINLGKLQGVADVADLTDRTNGTRFVVETKMGINAEALVHELFSLTSLEVSYGINNTVITPSGEPETLGLKALLQIFIDHRLATVLKRTEFRLQKKRDRLHHVDALLKALMDIDKAIDIIRNSTDTTTAQQKLMKAFKMDDIQAEYVLNLQLRRLTKFDQHELENEKDRLLKEIAPLEAILNDDKVLRKTVSEELLAVGKKLTTERHSEIVGVSLAEHIAESKKAVASASVEIADEPCFISFNRNGKVIRNAKPARNALAVASSTTRGKFIAVTNQGRGFRLESLHVGEKAMDLAGLLPGGLNAGERLLTVIPTDLPEGSVGGLTMGTKNGVVKVQAPNWPKTMDEFSVIGLAEGDEVLGARWVEDSTKYDFVFINNNSNLLRSKVEGLRPQGSLSAAGVAGFKFDPASEEILDFSVVSHEEIEGGALVVSVSDAANAKFTPLKNYPFKGRNTAGVRTLKLLRGEERLAFSTIATGEPVLETEDGTVLAPLPVDERRDGSGKPLGGIPVR